MKTFILCLALMLCLASVTEANGFAGAAFRSRERIVVRQQVNVQRIVVRQPVVAVRQRVVAPVYSYSARFVQPFTYGYSAQFVQPYALGLDAGCGCAGGSAGFGAPFRSRAFNGMGFGY